MCDLLSEKYWAVRRARRAPSPAGPSSPLDNSKWGTEGAPCAETVDHGAASSTVATKVTTRARMAWWHCPRPPGPDDVHLKLGRGNLHHVKEVRPATPAGPWAASAPAVLTNTAMVLFGAGWRGRLRVGGGHNQRPADGKRNRACA